MKRHATFILTVIAVAACALAWMRSGEVTALKRLSAELVRKRAALSAGPVESTSPAVPGTAPAPDPALKKLEAEVKEIARRSGDIFSPEMREALMKWLGAAASLSTPQLVQLAASAYRSFPVASEAEAVADELLMVIFGRDPGAALDAMLAIHPSSTNRFMNCLANWGTEDPAAARAWQKRAGSRLQGNPAVERAVADGFGIADIMDPSVHIPKILAQEGSANDLELRSEMARYLTTPVGSRPLLEAIGKYADVKKHDRLLDMAGVQAAKSMDPSALREFVAGAPLTDSDKLRLCTAAVTRNIDERTPERAAWMVSLCPDTASKSAAVTTLTAEWAQQDFNTAGKWINSLTGKENEPVRDAAAAKFAEVVTAIEPAAAAAWAHTISDATLRQESLRSVLSAWSRKDRPAAVAFVSSKGLPQELLPAGD